MPIYEFICQDCGREFEKLLSFSSTVTPECPSCQSIIVKRQMGLPAVHFKGSGWYKTDSKKSTDSQKSSADTATAPAEASEKSENTKESASTTETATDAKKSDATAPSATKASVAE